MLFRPLEVLLGLSGQPFTWSSGWGLAVPCNCWAVFLSWLPSRPCFFLLNKSAATIWFFLDWSGRLVGYSCPCDVGQLSGESSPKKKRSGTIMMKSPGLANGRTRLFIDLFKFYWQSALQWGQTWPYLNPWASWVVGRQDSFLLSVHLLIFWINLERFTLSEY